MRKSLKPALGGTDKPCREYGVRLPAKWIFIALGTSIGLSSLALTVSPTLRAQFTSGWEVRELLRFRERFRPENIGTTCPNDPLYRVAACVHRLIKKENRLHYASMTARIYYLSTISEVASVATEFARNRTETIETRADLLDYLNEEMKSVLVRTGGTIDLNVLDVQRDRKDAMEDPEAALTRRYYANLVDLWIKNWRKDEKFLAANRHLRDPDMTGRIEILRADRDELFTRLNVDLSRYDKRRVPAGTPTAE